MPGSGGATASAPGTPSSASTGVANAEPPAPNSPKTRPTPRPAAAITHSVTTTMVGLVDPEVQDEMSQPRISSAYGSPPPLDVPRRRRPRQLHAGGGGVLRVAARAVPGD